MFLLLGTLLGAHAADDPPERVPTGTLVVDAKVPTEIAVDGHRMATLDVAGRVSFQVASGHRTVRAWIYGTGRDLPIEILPNQDNLVVVGRTGLSVANAAPMGVAGPVAVELRVVGTEPLQVRLDDRRYALHEGGAEHLTLPPGRHDLSVRNASGTVVWAVGALQVDGTSPLVVQLTEGKAPEVSGTGAFLANGS